MDIKIRDIERVIAFYEKALEKLILELRLDGIDVAFLQPNKLVFEPYYIAFNIKNSIEVSVKCPAQPDLTRIKELRKKITESVIAMREHQSIHLPHMEPEW